MKKLALILLAGFFLMGITVSNVMAQNPSTSTGTPVNKTEKTDKKDSKGTHKGHHKGHKKHQGSHKGTNSK